MIDAPLPITITYQLIGIIAMIASFFSFQTRKQHKFLFMQTISCALFALQFGMTSAWGACFMNILCVGRGIFYYKKRNKTLNIVVTTLICLTFLAITLISSLDVETSVFIVSLICCSASITSTIVISTRNNLALQFFQLFYVSPCWIVNAIFYLSLGAFISETMNMVSVIINLTRRYIDYKKAKREA